MSQALNEATLWTNDAEALECKQVCVEIAAVLFVQTNCC